MKVGIVGAGRIGGTLARLLAQAGHEVAVSHSRRPATLEPLVASLPGRAKALRAEDAVRSGDVVVLAIPWRKRSRLPDPRLFGGKIVVDAMNPYSRRGTVLDLRGATSSGEVARQLPGARVVKAFNTIAFETLASGGKPPGADRLVIFVSGDDRIAKGIVARLIEDIGFTPVDLGSLTEGGRLQEPDSPLFVVPMTLAEASDALRRLGRSIPTEGGLTQGTIVDRHPDGR